MLPRDGGLTPCHVQPGSAGTLLSPHQVLRVMGSTVPPALASYRGAGIRDMVGSSQREVAWPPKMKQEG